MLPLKRARLHGALLGETSVSKSALSRILLILQSHGALAKGAVGEQTSESLRKELGKAAANIGNRLTPCGPVVKSIDLDGLQWSCISPPALINFLGERSPDFLGLMLKIMDQRGPLCVFRAVLYIDECRPGNVMRPDMGRTVQHALWTLVEDCT